MYFLLIYINTIIIIYLMLNDDVLVTDPSVPLPERSARFEYWMDAGDGCYYRRPLPSAEGYYHHNTNNNNNNHSNRSLVFDPRWVTARGRTPGNVLVSPDDRCVAYMEYEDHQDAATVVVREISSQRRHPVVDLHLV